MHSFRNIHAASTLLIAVSAVCTCGAYGANQATDAVKPAQTSVPVKRDSDGNAKIDFKTADKINNRPVTQNQKEDAKKTADSVNQVPGVRVTAKDMEPPSQPPITGFHPIKRLLRPVENLEGMSIKLEQQIMKLEGPIAGLHPPMMHLQDKMGSVESQLGRMKEQVSSTQQEVVGVRSDIAGMRKDIQALKQPLIAIEKPIADVSKPLEQVKTQLNIVVIAIFLAVVAIAFGTPIAAVVLYKYRDKFFPGLSKENTVPKELAGSAIH